MLYRPAGAAFEVSQVLARRGGSRAEDEAIEGLEGRREEVDEAVAFVGEVLYARAEGRVGPRGEGCLEKGELGAGEDFEMDVETGAEGRVGGGRVGEVKDAVGDARVF